MPTSGFSTKPLKVKLLAGEQKATEKRHTHISSKPSASLVVCPGPAKGFHRVRVPRKFCRERNRGSERNRGKLLLVSFGNFLFSPTAESFGVSAQIGSGVVRGDPELRFHQGSTRGSTRVPPGFHQGSTRVPPEFHQGSTRVPPGSARAGWSGVV